MHYYQKLVGYKYSLYITKLFGQNLELCVVKPADTRTNRRVLRCCLKPQARNDTYRQTGVQGTVAGECQLPVLCAVHLGKRTHEAHWTGGSVRPRTNLDAVTGIPIRTLRQESSFESPVVHPLS